MDKHPLNLANEDSTKFLFLKIQRKKTLSNTKSSCLIMWFAPNAFSNGPTGQEILGEFVPTVPERWVAVTKKCSGIAQTSKSLAMFNIHQIFNYPAYPLPMPFLSPMI